MNDQSPLWVFLFQVMPIVLISVGTVLGGIYGINRLMVFTGRRDEKTRIKHQAEIKRLETKELFDCQEYRAGLERKLLNESCGVIDGEPVLDESHKWQ